MGCIKKKKPGSNNKSNRACGVHSTQPGNTYRKHCLSIVESIEKVLLTTWRSTLRRTLQLAGLKGDHPTAKQAKKTSGAATQSPASRQKLTDSTARIPTCLSTQGNASQTPLAASRKRNTTEPALQRTGKRQKTRPLTMEDIPTIVRAARDALPEPNESCEDIQNTEGSVSTGSYEFGTLLMFYCICMHSNHIYIHPQASPLQLGCLQQPTNAACNSHLPNMLAIITWPLPDTHGHCYPHT